MLRQGPSCLSEAASPLAPGASRKQQEELLPSPPWCNSSLAGLVFFNQKGSVFKGSRSVLLLSTEIGERRKATPIFLLVLASAPGEGSRGWLVRLALGRAVRSPGRFPTPCWAPAAAQGTCTDERDRIDSLTL